MTLVLCLGGIGWVVRQASIHWYDVQNDGFEIWSSQSNPVSSSTTSTARGESMPVWPFDTGTLLKFASILGTVVLSFVVEWLRHRMLTG